MKKHIVLIEDEAGIRDNYRAAFERRGYRVSTFGDRPAAWQVLRQSLPDLAIIDVGLGDEPEGGFTLCHDLRAQSRSEEHTSELQSRENLVCRLLLEKKN